MLRRPLFHHYAIGASLKAFILLLFCIAGLIAATLPSMAPWIEYSAIKRAAVRIEQSNDKEDASLRRIFDAAASVDNIRSITSKDLDIENSGSAIVVHFSYSASVKLIGNASIVYEFSR